MPLEDYADMAAKHFPAVNLNSENTATVPKTGDKVIVFFGLPKKSPVQQRVSYNAPAVSFCATNF